jgi:hypothetical protein
MGLGAPSPRSMRRRDIETLASSRLRKKVSGARNRDVNFFSLLGRGVNQAGRDSADRQAFELCRY